MQIFEGITEKKKSYLKTFISGASSSCSIYFIIIFILVFSIHHYLLTDLIKCTMIGRHLYYKNNTIYYNSVLC